LKKKRTEGKITITKYKKIVKKLRIRRSRLVKVGITTFKKKEVELKKKVEEKKISVKTYKKIIYKYRSHMTISFSSYTTKI